MMYSATKNPTVRLIFVGLEEIDLLSSLSNSRFNSKGMWLQKYIATYYLIMYNM